MQIAILGDSHDHYDNLRKAVEIANEHGCELMLHTGDLGAANKCIDILANFYGQIKMVAGNNDHEQVILTRRSLDGGNFEFVKTKRGGNSFEDEIDGIKIFMHHYPRIGEIAASSGEFDLCIYGHSHKYREEMIGDTLLLNPGALHPEGTVASMVIFDTKKKEVKKIEL